MGVQTANSIVRPQLVGIKSQNGLKVITDPKDPATEAGVRFFYMRTSKHLTLVYYDNEVYGMTYHDYMSDFILTNPYNFNDAFHKKLHIVLSELADG